MKKAILFTCIVFLSLTTLPIKGFSQFYTWMPQQALTDSSADNTHPCLIHFMDASWNDHIILFWERAESSTETAIWYRHLDDHSLSDPAVLISAPGVDFTHPVALLLSDTPVNDTAFSVIFGNDEAGDVNLYFMNYCVDGTFSAPRPLSMLPGDDLEAAVCSGWVDYLAWNNGGKIYTSLYDWQNQMYAQPQELQTTNAECPSGDEKSLAYLSQDEDTSRVMYFNNTYKGGYTYDGPFEMYGGGENAHLQVCKSFNWGGTVGLGYTWQNRQNGGLWGIINKQDGWSGSYLWEIRSGAFNYYSPDIFDFPIIIKFPLYLTFVTDSLGNEEVMTCQPGLYDIQNQSNYAGPDRNPHFFSSVEYSVYQIQLLWESFRNGHWTIFRSHYDMMFSDPELQEGKAGTAYPNPFRNRVTIRVAKDTGGEGRIVDLLNVPVKTLKPQSENSGPYIKYVWDGCDASGKPVPVGTYVFITSGTNGRQVVRLIKQ